MKGIFSHAFIRDVISFYENRMLEFIDRINRRKLTADTYLLKKMDEQILKRNFDGETNESKS